MRGGQKRVGDEVMALLDVTKSRGLGPSLEPRCTFFPQGLPVFANNVLLDTRTPQW